MRLAIIIGSIRQGRFGPTAAEWLHARACRRDDFEVDVIDLAEAWLPNVLPVEGGDAVPPAVQDLKPWLAAADAYVIVTPEYNHSFPASLKNAIDWYHDEWRAKPVAFVSYGGASGGLRAVEQLRQVFAALEAVIVEEPVAFYHHRTPTDLDAERLLDALDQEEKIMSASREIRLAAYPFGEPRPEDFELASTKIPEPAEGQVLVRNTWMSVDPYMRERMHEAESYLPPLQLGASMDGSAVGEVVASRAETVPVGATVVHFLGWREYAVLDAAAATVVDTALAPAEAYLGALGTTGLTAYAALTEVAPVRQGDVVFVSAAAGAVGSVAGQLARKLGASRVIGSAGGPRKATKLVADFGYDAAIDYRAPSLAGQLAKAAPVGIDVYVDLVGGDLLVAAIDALRSGGRIAMVGAISSYNATEPVPGPSNLFQLAAKDATLRGMLINSYFHLFPEWVVKAAGWLADGSLHTELTVAEGIEQAPAAFLDMMHGRNVGKMLVRL